MVPNYKRPSVREYLHDAWETGPTDQDIDMLLYLEECERRSKILDKVLDYPFFTEECPLSCTDDSNEENIIYDACDCYYESDGDNCNNFKECWLKYFERKMEDERNAR